ncbi:MAG: Gldg family protein [Marinifilaceae bacterium]|nr:Gldg family protein [Marinifilaceae bacterium]
MRKIYEIAKAELQSLFYSPIAWLIIIIFVFQISLVFSSTLETLVTTEMMGYQNSALTMKIFANPMGNGLLFQVQNYLYLYIPLLTMGLMSRELSSGSIKLLYSSPLTNTQIIFGKYVSMLVYALLLTLIVGVYVLFGCCVIENVEWRWLLTGLLGIFLLICTYAAIGLFMSSLTSYQIVAAIGTLTVLAILNYIGRMWQDVEFVRDITYWFSLSGRSTSFLLGFIGSENVIYFIVVITLFLSLTIVRLQACRQKASWTTSLSKYAVILVLVVLVGYITSRPSMKHYYDATVNKVNTLTPNSQEVVEKMDGGLTITTYVNALDDGNISIAFPRYVNADMARFSQYQRFKPEIKLKYVYYYDSINNPSLERRFPNMTMEERALRLMDLYKVSHRLFLKPGEVDRLTDLSREGKTFVRELVRENGRRTFLRIFDDFEKLPSEAEITAAFKRITMDLPVVGFLQGHGERSISEMDNRSFSAFVNNRHFRHALINQGFNAIEVLSNQVIPDSIGILVIADPQEMFTEKELQYLKSYVDRGGNLLILGEPKRCDILNPLTQYLGVTLQPDVLVNKGEYTNLVQAYVAKEIGESDLLYQLYNLYRVKAVIAMPNAAPLTYTSVQDFKMTKLFVTDTLTWSEVQSLDFSDGEQRPTCDESVGEKQQEFTVGLTLTRMVGEKEQKIVVLGDADCLSNGELSSSRRGVRAANFTMIPSFFHWMSDGEVPVDIRRPAFKDNILHLSYNEMVWASTFFQWIFPGVLLLLALFVWIRRRSR